MAIKGITIEGLDKVQIQIGAIEEEEVKWEPMGPTPFPSITTLRNWDHILLNRYKPFYSPLCDMCCLCTYGKCDLTDKRGACGIDIKAQQARIVLLACCIGTAAHTAHARHLLHHLIETQGEDKKIDMGLFIEVEAPIMRTVTGIKPKKLGDLKKALDYCEEQLTHCLSATHTGQEGSYLDFESKALHVGMIDNLAKEIGDIAQIIGYNYPRGEPEAPLVDIGMAAIDSNKPVILVIGHNVMPSIGMINYLRSKNLMDKVEVAGLCCTAHDITRYESKAKVVGPISRQLQFIRSGIADVIVTDEQCVRADVPDEAAKVKAPVISTSDKICYNLPDRTKDAPAKIISDLVSGKQSGALILDPDKVGEVAVEVALKLAPQKKLRKFSKEDIKKFADTCSECGDCRRNCPIDSDIPDAMAAAKRGDIKKFAQIYEACLGCGRCEEACNKNTPIVEMIRWAISKEDRAKMRVGRGPIRDTEIRNVGAPIVLGEIPGVIAYVGCANYPRGRKDVIDMAEEFLQRRYILISSGCAAMDIAMELDAEGKSIYERYSGEFDAGCIVNVGSCVANAHIVGAAIKIANIFARRNLRANFEEIADYILNRVGAVGVAWGAYSQKAASIATGCNRWGIPVVVGPHSSKYRRLYLGRADKDEDWMVYNARTGGENTYVGPAPEHLICAAETKEEAIVMTAKLCIRPNDTTKGRAIKLTHYIDLHEKYFGTLPDDWHFFVRNKMDLPVVKKEMLSKELEKMGWKQRIIPDPTLLERFKGGWK